MTQKPLLRTAPAWGASVPLPLLLLGGLGLGPGEGVVVQGPVAGGRVVELVDSLPGGRRLQQ